MAESEGGEKSLPASPQKKQKAREKGNVAKSQDLSTAFTLLVAFLALWGLGPGVFGQLMLVMRHFLTETHVLILAELEPQSLAAQTLLMVAPGLVMFMLALMLAGVAINVAQFGPLFSTQALAPKFSKLNPITGFQRFFKLRTLVELVKSLFKLGLIGLVVWATLRGRIPDILSLTHMSPQDGGLAVWDLVLTVWWRVALVMLLLGILDFAYQRWQHEQDLRMTQQEARQELKEMEGDPKIKQRVRQIQRQIAMQRMIAEVPDAEVVITNPTAYAVALRYDPKNMGAPTVVAKGARLIAQRIRNLAIEHDVPIVERPELARALFRTVPVGSPVTEDLFKAVAEVLAFVYQIDRRHQKIRERAAADLAAPAMG